MTKLLEFDWSTLTRSSLEDYLLSLSSQIANKELTIDEFHLFLKKHIQKQFPVKVSKKYENKVPFNDVFIGGSYYSDSDKYNKKCIEIILVYNKSCPYVRISLRRFKNICLSFADTILHEIIHMRQHRRRKFKVLPDYASTAEKTEKRQEQSYLGCSDEIDAYGFNIACELYDRFNGKQNLIVKYLSTNYKFSRIKGDTWKMYIKAFDHNQNHIVIRKLKKKIIRYLPLADIGKPYRNKDWINW